MNRRIIIIEGYLASGKSTFAVRLSGALKIPYVVKDTFKEALCTSMQITNREESSRFSAVAFDGMMYVTERLMETGFPFIIEGNFVPAGVKKKDEAGAIKALIDKYDYRTLTFKFRGNPELLHKRFVERDTLPERGQANTLFSVISYENFCKNCQNLENFDAGGRIVIVDTTDFKTVNFAGLIDTSRNFLTNG
ncbi:MAG: ATP-binding protein [Treponema sp.]|nr:ATP-binding protein [Treponema sp.]